MAEITNTVKPTEAPTSKPTEAPTSKPQYCNGTFRMLTSDCFTQDENYCDDYLKSKGLFKVQKD